MENYAKLIHKSNLTYLPTKLPVQFYGLPDGKVHIVYARFYEVGYNKSGIEYVFAVHNEFSYNYEKERLVANNFSNWKFHLYNEMVDKPDPNIKIVKVYRSINNFAEALTRLNNKAHNLIKKQNSKGEDESHKITTREINTLSA